MYTRTIAVVRLSSIVELWLNENWQSSCLRNNRMWKYIPYQSLLRQTRGDTKKIIYLHKILHFNFGMGCEHRPVFLTINLQLAKLKNASLQPNPFPISPSSDPHLFQIEDPSHNCYRHSTDQLLPPVDPSTSLTLSPLPSQHSALPGSLMFSMATVQRVNRDIIPHR